MNRKLMLKTTLATGLVAAFALTGTAYAQDKGSVGVSMPTKSSARWISDGDSMVKVLKDKGYKADLQYARIDEILATGLHAFLTQFLDRVNELGMRISRDFLIPSTN